MSNRRMIRVLYAIHKWTGLIAGINVLILSLTAGYLLAEAMVHEWSHREPHGADSPIARMAPREERSPVQPLIDRLLAYYAGHDLHVSRVELGVNPGEPDKIAFSGVEQYFRLAVDSESGVLSVDQGEPPATAEDSTRFGLQFAESGAGAQDHGYTPLGQWMLQLHAKLFLGMAGTILTGVVGVLLLISTVTGLVIYAPFMKALIFGAIRRGGRLNQTLADLHKLVGVITLGFNGMMALTGIGLTLGLIAIQFYLLHELKAFEASGGAIMVADPPPSIDLVLRKGQETLPGLHIYRVDYPGGIQGEKSYAVYAQETSGDRGLIPIVAAVTAEAEPRANRFAMPLWIKAIVVGIPIHVGSFGGNLVRLIYLPFALSSGLLSITGFVMYAAKWRRRRVATPGAPASEEQAVVTPGDGRRVEI